MSTPGFAPGATTLVAEGFELIDGDLIVESFARHLLTAFDRWNGKGLPCRRRGLSGPAAEKGRLRAAHHRRQRRSAGKPARGARPGASEPAGRTWCGGVVSIPSRTCREAGDHMKLLRTIRLDPPTHSYSNAPPTRVSGSLRLVPFPRWRPRPTQLETAPRAALGLSRNRQPWFSTLATVAEASEEELAAARETLTQGFLETLGAPSPGRRARGSQRRTSLRTIGSAITLWARLLPSSAASVKMEQFANSFAPCARASVNENQDALHAFARAFTFHEVEDDSKHEDEIDLLTISKDSSK